MIEQTGTVYRTRKLTCANYTWLWRCDGVERQLPFLLERKRAGMLDCVTVGPTAFCSQEKVEIESESARRKCGVGMIGTLQGLGGEGPTPAL